MASAVGMALVPVAAMVLGAGAAMLRRPGPVLTGIVQHLAAGVVFAAAAGEIPPGLKRGGAALPILIGGTAGVAAMLLIKQLGRRAAGPVGLAATAGVDLLVDGLVLGIGFAAGARQGLLLGVALTLEVLFLGLTLAVAFCERLPPLRALAATAVRTHLITHQPRSADPACMGWAWAGAWIPGSGRPPERTLDGPA